MIADTSGSITATQRDAALEELSSIPTVLDAWGFAADEGPFDLEEYHDFGSFGASKASPAVTRALDGLAEETRVRLGVIVTDGTIDDTTEQWDTTTAVLAAEKVQVWVVHLGTGPLDPRLTAVATSTGGQVLPSGTAVVNALNTSLFDSGADTDLDTLTDCQEQSGRVLSLRPDGSVQAEVPRFDAADSEGDEVPDNVELLTRSDDPQIVAAEYAAIGTVRVRASSPTSKDTDGDGYSDMVERAAGKDPLTPEPGVRFYAFMPEAVYDANFGEMFPTEWLKTYLSNSDYWPEELFGPLNNHNGNTDAALFGFALQQAAMSMDHADEALRSATSIDLFGLHIGSWYAIVDALGEGLPKTAYTDTIFDRNLTGQADYVLNAKGAWPTFFSAATDVRRSIIGAGLTSAIGEELIVTVILRGTGQLLGRTDRLARVAQIWRSQPIRHIANSASAAGIYCSVRPCPPELVAIANAADLVLGLEVSKKSVANVLNPNFNIPDLPLDRTAGVISVRTRAFDTDANGYTNWERRQRDLPPVAGESQPAGSSLSADGTTELVLPQHANGRTPDTGLFGGPGFTKSVTALPNSVRPTSSWPTARSDASTPSDPDTSSPPLTPSPARNEPPLCSVKLPPTTGVL